nr:stage II sporulation protein D [Pontibacillus litoralis]
MRNKSLFLFIGVLMAIILIIPTIIVVPFTGASKDQSEKPNEPKSKQQEINLLEASEVNVSVMRSQKDTVEDVPLEVYVSRVVASEMPADFELEALKAQALAARTYIVQYLSHEDGANVTDTVQHQVYKNDEELRKIWESDYEWKMDKIEQAVKETAGEILTYNNQPITAAFFSTSNGFTENSEDYWPNEIPYLRSVESPWDKQSPKYNHQQVFTTEQLEQALGLQLSENAPLLSNMKKTESNRVSEVTIGNKTFTGREIRESLQLQSTDFSVEQKNDHVIFTTKGYGHGIGMSQYGANGMAQEGKSYEEIVKHYYNGIDIAKVNDHLPKLASK